MRSTLRYVPMPGPKLKSDLQARRGLLLECKRIRVLAAGGSKKSHQSKTLKSTVALSRNTKGQSDACVFCANGLQTNYDTRKIGVFLSTNPWLTNKARPTPGFDFKSASSLVGLRLTCKLSTKPSKPTINSCTQSGGAFPHSRLS